MKSGEDLPSIPVLVVGTKLDLASNQDILQRRCSIAEEFDAEAIYTVCDLQSTHCFLLIVPLAQTFPFQCHLRFIQNITDFTFTFIFPSSPTFH